MLVTAVLLAAAAAALLVTPPRRVHGSRVSDMDIPIVAGGPGGPGGGRQGARADQVHRRAGPALVGAGAVTAWVVTTSALTGTQLAVAGVAVGAAAAAARGVAIARRADRARRRRRAVVDFCEALVGELRAGQPVLAALERSAAVWPEIGPGGRVPGSRYLEHWYTRLRTARAGRLAETADLRAAGLSDPVLTTIKLTYASAIGRLDAETAAGKSPLFRPDWRHHVIGTARANLLRKLASVAQTSGRYPLAIATDCVLYASSDPDPQTACPAGLPYDPHGVDLGKAKPKGSVPLAAALPLLRAARRPDKSALLDLFDGEE